MKKAIAAGHICLDITPAFTGDKPSDIGEILRPGKVVMVGAPDVHTGGSAANTGLAMRKLGADVKLVAKVGNDTFGGLVKSILDEHDAEGDLIIDEHCSTSYSVVLAIPGTDRIFLHDPGANDTFDGNEISDEVLEGIDLFHFGYPTLMKRMYENGGVYLKEMLKRIREKGIITSLDMSAVDPKSEAGAVDWKAVLQEILPFVDIFVPSFEELCFMLDRPRLERLSDEAGNKDITDIIQTDTDVKPLLQKCHEMGAKIVLIKCGAQGLFLSVRGNISRLCDRLELKEEEWKDFESFQRSFHVDRVVSATGAGDVSIAAFLASLLKKNDPVTAVENAAAAGALCCMTYDAISNIRPLNEIRALIEDGWKENEVFSGRLC